MLTGTGSQAAVLDVVVLLLDETLAKPSRERAKHDRAIHVDLWMQEVRVT